MAPIVVPYWSANLPSDVLMDTGTLFHGNVLIASSTLVGGTRGAVKFDPGWSIESIKVDGTDAPIKGLHRKFYGAPKLSFTITEFGPASTGNQIAKLDAGSTAVDSGTTPNTLTTITPKVGRGLYPTADYMTYFRVVFRRGIATGVGVKAYAGVCFPTALVTKWDLAGQEKDAALISVEVEGCRDMASGTTADAPYLIELYES